MYPLTLPYADWVHCQCRDFFTEAPCDYIYTTAFDNYSIGLHEHNFYEMNIVTGGTGTHYFGEQIIPVQRGHVFMVTPGIYHGYYQEQSLSVLHILLHPDFLSCYREQLKALPGLVSFLSVEPSVRASGAAGEMYLRLSDEQLESLLLWSRELYNVLESAYKGRYVQANGIMLLILGALGRWYSALEGSSAQDSGLLHNRAVIHSVETIQAEYSSKLTVDYLAKKCGMSRTCYLQAFRRLFRCSPGEYITRYRLLQAKELLSGSELSVGEIALQCGFYDNSHLVRFFTRQEGISPRKYREEVTSYKD